MKRIAIIPASGIGSRMHAKKPKQYLLLDNGMTVLDTTIARLLESPFFDTLIIAVNRSDTYWKHSIHTKNERIKLCYGGEERSDSVRNALISIKDIAEDDDWIFVHDAARVCISLDDIRRLYASVVVEKSIGGILATKAIDTVKEVNDKGYISKTLHREKIYLAQTPQVFRYKTLLMAYYFCLHNNIKVTDEASAIEALDHQPMVIEGDRRNIKITTPEDLVLANYFLSTL
ncbi:2-C-methyl-D-erythritol 4-phosphate cytidylyltransferase [Fangia hongkongensis]|uniref:2-C-methyl-D-erythritol 4-phosphate cytidylyltransferase n=1 Tax=Fangia hongkongensis TaxID=270495 RepID=UPI00036FDC86|nr:2-C-methyl-D-erythritol 4-phosphate cytidylyltransferase [Fangia hongkongensis]MBK2126089.1 2-C-methyl-D-erythritol 4-phosphate cytidylyltransferase [Fangia hongkongensis]